MSSFCPHLTFSEVPMRATVFGLKTKSNDAEFAVRPSKICFSEKVNACLIEIDKFLVDFFFICSIIKDIAL